jgi:hypothetical protein
LTQNGCGDPAHTVCTAISGAVINDITMSEITAPKLIGIEFQRLNLPRQW